MNPDLISIGESRALELPNTLGRIFVRLIPRTSRWRWCIAQRGELDWWARELRERGWKQWTPDIDEFLRHRQEGLERRKELWGIDLSPYLNGDRLILDLGCGPYSLLGLPRVVGVDPLMRGYGKLVDLRADRGTIYTEAKGESLPFADDYFDSIWSRNVLDHVHRPARLLVEAFRVLSANGYFVLVFDKQSRGGVLHAHIGLTPDWVLSVLRQARRNISFDVIRQHEVRTEYLMILQKRRRS